ncbi:zinc-binding dehydrogenase [Nocardia sp. NBC_01499]|uniref:zinc-binding dehydrogenase n=1 Tax=Nocardia sp. NBC_01499 TaxID=2903597 RepID=UPI00386CBC75
MLFVSPVRAKLAALGQLVDQGKLRPVIGVVLPLADIAQAHHCWNVALPARATTLTRQDSRRCVPPGRAVEPD